MLTHLDLCSGIGGFALAARWHGMRTVGFAEIDPWCRRVLAKNFPGVPQHDNVTTLDGGTVRRWIQATHHGRTIHDADERREYAELAVRAGRHGAGDASLNLLTAGYPCQPFSLAGKRLGEEDDRHLWPYIAGLVRDLRPTWCLFENVAGHITLGLDRVLSDLEEIGYACWPVVVPACAVNAPHRRDRVWIIARSVADAERWGRGEQLRTNAAQGALPATERAQGASWFGSGGEAVAHAPRLGEREPADEAHTGGGGGWEVESGLGGSSPRLSRWMARPWDGDWEAGVPRVTDGCPDRVNKLKALGNAIVPQVAYVLMGAMLDATRQHDRQFDPISGHLPPDVPPNQGRVAREPAELRHVFPSIRGT